METLDKIFKDYGYDKQTSVIHKAITNISEYLQKVLDKDQYCKVIKDTYCTFVGGH